MANSLKNVSILLSPKFFSPLSPSRNLVSVPKSEGKMCFRQISKSNAAKKLDFSATSKNFATVSNYLNKTKIPDIKIHRTLDDTQGDFQYKSTSSNVNVLDINTPIKHDLVEHGLDKFKNQTTVLGKGTFGTVFKGKHKGDTVAVKIVTRESSFKERNALCLHHKNLARTLEIIQNSDYQNYSLIIMEYLPNSRTLQEVLNNFHLGSFKGSSETLLKQFALDITTGLHYLHSNDVIHLDLKPKNILVDVENICKICDFGNSAKISDNLDDFKHNGTIIYTAPEILLGKPPTIKSDIYSLGLVFWQIKYKKNPFQEYETMESIIYNIGKHDVRPTYQGESSTGLESIFTKCWNSNPQLRPTTADILKGLKDVQF